MTTFVPIKVEIIRIVCYATDNLTGEDNIYYLHSLKCTDRPRNTEIERPMPKQVEESLPSSTLAIYDEDRNNLFPTGGMLTSNENVLFNRECDVKETPRQSINGTIYFFDGEGPLFFRPEFIQIAHDAIHDPAFIRGMFTLSFLIFPPVTFFFLFYQRGFFEGLLGLISAPITAVSGLLFSLGVFLYG